MAEDNLLHEFSANSQLLMDVKAGHPRHGQETAALPPLQLPWVSGNSWWVWLQKAILQHLPELLQSGKGFALKRSFPVLQKNPKDVFRRTVREVL